MADDIITATAFINTGNWKSKLVSLEAVLYQSNDMVVSYFVRLIWMIRLCLIAPVLMFHLTRTCQFAIYLNQNQ